MKHLLSERINNMAISATLAMAAKARELRATGKKVIGLSLGEPDFNVPDFVKEAAIEAIHQNYSAYSPVDGYAELKEAVCHKFKRDNDLSYKPSEVVVSTGAKQSLANVALAMINPGDEIIIPAPYWVSYVEIVKLAEGTPIEISTGIETDFKITPAQLEAAITPKTKMIWFNSPCNPSGSIYTKQELEALSKVILSHKDIYVLSDEIYEYINFEGKHASIAGIPGMMERTITINGVSKAFAMTGWRIGYMGAPEWIAKACNKIQGQITSGANTIAQRASITALMASPEKIQYMVDSFRERRDLVVKLLSEIPGLKANVPQGAFYIFPDVSHYYGKTLKGKLISNSDDMAMYLLEEAGVATVAGGAFGDDRCIRISYAASETDIREAIDSIKKSLS